jgi:broad specificity phosphatase PhoE
VKVDGSVKARAAAGVTLSAMEPLETQALPARLTLISHAATLALRRASFPLDEPIIEGELEKIAALGWLTPRAQQVLCGPEQRVQQTAKALGLEASLAAELADVDYGSWRGKEVHEIHASDLDGLAAWLTDVEATPHGGESLVQLIARVGRWMADQTAAGHTVAVTHPSVIRAAILCTLQAPPQSFWRIEIAPLAVTDLRFNGRLWTARYTGCPLSRS